MKTRTATLTPTDFRPVLALAILCAVAFSPAGASASVEARASGSSLVAAAAAVPLMATADSLNILADQIIEVNSALVEVVLAYGAIFSVEPIPQVAAAAGAYPAPVAKESLVATLAYLPESLYETAGKTTDFLSAVQMAPVYVITDALSETLFKAGVY